MCLDTRPLNKKTVADPFTAPIIKELFTRIHGFQIATLLDLKEGYHQVKLRSEDCWKTGFTWKNQSYEWVGTPFGLMNAPAEFQRIMERVLQAHRLYITIYLDDILIFSNSVEEHIEHVRAVLKTLSQYHLKISIEKSKLAYSRLNLLGHLVDGNSIRPNPARISAFQELPKPRTGKDVERYLGIANYLRDYIPLYSRIAAPLEKLRKRKILGDAWTLECDIAWKTLKDVLSNAPILTSPNWDKPFLVGTDASNLGVGAVLYQEYNDRRFYIEFVSCALTSGQRNYSATRRELLAIIFALKKFRYYLYGRHFTIFTDHRALEFLFRNNHENAMLNFWAETLLDYSFDHRPGVAMVLEDALSRLYKKEEVNPSDLYKAGSALVFSVVSSII